MESNPRGFILHHGELADKHLGEGGIHQVAVRLGDRGWWLSESHMWLQLKRGGRRGEKLGGSHHIIYQPSILLL